MLGGVVGPVLIAERGWAGLVGQVGETCHGGVLEEAGKVGVGVMEVYGLLAAVNVVGACGRDGSDGGGGRLKDVEISESGGAENRLLDTSSLGGLGTCGK